MSTRNEKRSIKLWQIGGSEKAIKFLAFPPGDPNVRIVWIPRSIIHHMSKDKPLNCGTIPVIAEVEEWFLESLGI